MEEDEDRQIQILRSPPHTYLPLLEDEIGSDSAKTGLGGPNEIGGSHKGKVVDVKGTSVADVKGKGADIKGKSVDVKGKGKDDKGKGVDLG